MYNIGIIHVFYALTFAGSKGNCLNSMQLGREFKHLPRDPSLRERLGTHKVFTKDQCFYLNYHKFSIKSYVLDVY